MPRRQYRKCDGTMTANAKTMADSWYAVIRPIEQCYGLKIMGFDPGFLFRDGASGATVDIPKWLAERMLLVSQHRESTVYREE